MDECSKADLHLAGTANRDAGRRRAPPSHEAKLPCRTPAVRHRPLAWRRMIEGRGVTTFRASADAYDRHIGRYGPPLAAALISAARVETGQRALDVGCGTGALTAALADLLGGEHVAGVDPSESFVEACASRLPQVRMEVGVAESLPFGDAAFDVALSQMVLNFMTDARAGVREMRRVTRPGGTVASAVWDYKEGMALLRHFWDAAVELDIAAMSRDEARMPYCRPDELERLWRAAGLEDVATSALVVEAAYDDFDDLWQPVEAGVGPSGAYAAALQPQRRAELRDELYKRLDAGESPFRLPARAWCVVGRVP
jgi:SAM-dependent methyltransferase